MTPASSEPPCVTGHYEIAGYEACISMAKTLATPKVAKLLSSNLKEELTAAAKITAAGTPIMKQSAQEREVPREQKTGKEKYSAKMSKEDEAKAARDLKRPTV